MILDYLTATPFSKRVLIRQHHFMMGGETVVIARQRYITNMLYVLQRVRATCTTTMYAVHIKNQKVCQRNAKGSQIQLYASLAAVFPPARHPPGHRRCIRTYCTSLGTGRVRFGTVPYVATEPAYLPFDSAGPATRTYIFYASPFDPSADAFRGDVIPVVITPTVARRPLLARESYVRS